MNASAFSGSWAAGDVTATVAGNPSAKAHPGFFLGSLYNEVKLARRVLADSVCQPVPLDRVRRCFENSGTKGFQALEGDFSAVFHARHPDRLVLLRDAHGTGRWYFARHEGRLYFATTLAALLDDLPASPPLNLEHLAKLLTASMYGDPSETAYVGIRQIPPGHALVADADGERLECYWRPPSAPPDPGAAHGRELEEQFVHMVSTAVQRRLDPWQKPAMALSAGLDSTTLAVIAAEHLSGTDRWIDAYTAAPAFDLPDDFHRDRLVDESGLARQLCDRHPSLRHHVIRDRSATLLDAMDDVLERLRRPVFAASNTHWLVALCRSACAARQDAILTGQTGNATISWPGNRTRYLRTLLRDRQWKRLAGEWRAYRSLHDLDLVTATRKLAVPVLLPDRWSETIRGRRLDNDSLCRNSALRSTFARELDLANTMRRDTLFPRSPHHELSRNRLLMAGVRAPAGEFAELAETYGLHAPDPTADRELIEWCFSQPESVYLGQGQTRRLLKRAMAGKLPAEILENSRKGLQAADVLPRIRAERPAFDEALGDIDSHPVARELIDSQKLREVLDLALSDDSEATAGRAKNELMRGLMVGRLVCRHGS